MEYWVSNPSLQYSNPWEAIDGSTGLTMSGIAYLKFFLYRSS
jgi:hypothetical protein